MDVLRHWPWNKNDWREWCVRGVASGGTPPSWKQMAFFRVDPLLHYERSRERVNWRKLRDEFFEISPNGVRQGNALLERSAEGLWPETRHGRKNNKYDCRNHPDSCRLLPLLGSLPLCIVA